MKFLSLFFFTLLLAIRGTDAARKRISRENLIVDAADRIKQRYLRSKLQDDYESIRDLAADMSMIMSKSSDDNDSHSGSPNKRRLRKTRSLELQDDYQSIRDLSTNMSMILNRDLSTEMSMSQDDYF